MTVIQLSTEQSDGEQWCIYSHHIPGHDEPIYLGCCPLNNVYRFPDARNNSKWIELVDPATPITITILQIGERVGMANHRFKLASMAPKPICNASGFNINRAAIKIQCIETGEIYANQRECALAIGADQSNLSNHLNRLKNVKTVKGKTYKRIL